MSKQKHFPFFFYGALIAVLVVLVSFGLSQHNDTDQASVNELPPPDTGPEVVLATHDFESLKLPPPVLASDCKVLSSFKFAGCSFKHRAVATENGYEVWYEACLPCGSPKCVDQVAVQYFGANGEANIEPKVWPHERIEWSATGDRETVGWVERNESSSPPVLYGTRPFVTLWQEHSDKPLTIYSKTAQVLWHKNRFVVLGIELDSRDYTRDFAIFYELRNGALTTFPSWKIPVSEIGNDVNGEDDSSMRRVTEMRSAGETVAFAYETRNRKTGTSSIFLTALSSFGLKTLFLAEGTISLRQLLADNGKYAVEWEDRVSGSGKLSHWTIVGEKSGAPELTTAGEPRDEQGWQYWDGSFYRADTDESSNAEYPVRLVRAQTEVKNRDAAAVETGGILWYATTMANRRLGGTKRFAFIEEGANGSRREDPYRVTFLNCAN